MYMATKLGRLVTCHEGLPPIKSHEPLITGSREITSQTKKISTTGAPMVTKLGRMLTCFNELLPLKSQDFSIAWHCKIT